MTVLDRKIKYSFLIIVAIAAIFNFVSMPYIMFSIVTSAIWYLATMVYIFFMVAHMALCFPLFLVNVYTHDMLRFSEFMKNLKSKSIILYYTIQLTVHAIVNVIVYGAIPYLLFGSEMAVHFKTFGLLTE